MMAQISSAAVAAARQTASPSVAMSSTARSGRARLVTTDGATSRAGKKMEQLIKTRGQWRPAWIEHQMAKGLSADDAKSKAPLLPTFAWPVILGWLVLLIVVTVSIAAWLMTGYSPQHMQV